MAWTTSYCGDSRSSDRALASPPVALTLHVFGRSLTEIGRADHDDLEALRPGLVASPRTARPHAQPRPPPPASCACGRTESDSRAGRAGSSGRTARAHAPRFRGGTPSPARRRSWTRDPLRPPLRFLSVYGTAAVSLQESCRRRFRRTRSSTNRCGWTSRRSELAAYVRPARRREHRAPEPGDTPLTMPVALGLSARGGRLRAASGSPCETRLGCLVPRPASTAKRVPQRVGARLSRFAKTAPRCLQAGC